MATFYADSRRFRDTRLAALASVPEVLPTLQAPPTRAYFDARENMFQQQCMYTAACNGGKRVRKAREVTNIGGKRKLERKRKRKRKGNRPTKELKSCLRIATGNREAKKIVRFAPQFVDRDELADIPFAILSATWSLRGMALI